jgi:predicted Rossmann fold flavoprotein
LNFDIIVIGAGGAGMMCAIRAAQRGRTVCLLDHSSKIGRKILISGGGRCNFTNIHATSANYVSRNPHFAKSALSRFTPKDFIGLVKKHRISFHEKKLGQLFCDGSAEAIVKLLVGECEDAGAQFKLSCNVKSVRKDDRFYLRTNLGEFTCDALVVASGGLSIPKIGATGFGYDLARQFGLKIVEPFPALVGFDFKQREYQQFAELAGVSVDSEVSGKGPAFRENTLFTHTGVSGPAVLQASLYWWPEQELLLNLCPDVDIREWLIDKKKSGAKTEVKNLLADILPKRLAERFSEVYWKSGRLSEMPDKVIEDFASKLNSWRIVPKDNFGYAKAEVTRGGVDTDELSSKTMEAKKVPGLYFIGEVVDVTGQLGGFNFQWAWASGYAAGEAV